jgi:hypothetical protein
LGNSSFNGAIERIIERGGRTEINRPLLQVHEAVEVESSVLEYRRWPLCHRFALPKKLERQSSRSRPIGFRGVNFKLLLRRMWLRSQACAKNIAPMAIVNPMILSAFMVLLPTDRARE